MLDLTEDGSIFQDDNKLPIGNAINVKETS